MAKKFGPEDEKNLLKTYKNLAKGGYVPKLDELAAATGFTTGTVAKQMGKIGLQKRSKGRPVGAQA